MGRMASRARKNARVRGGAGPKDALIGIGCVLIAACAPDRPDRLSHRPRDAFLEAVPCRDEVVATLDEWGAGAEYLGAPPQRRGSGAYRFPTAILGQWVVVEVPADGPPVVVRSTDTTVTARRFGASCAPDEVESSRPVRASDEGPRFTDADLRSLMASEGDGLVVIYVWAPHMPLSVDGYDEVTAAGTAVDATVVPLLIAYSDLDFATREARRVGIPADGLRQIDATELVLRDAQLHAPSILVFGRDRVSPVLPGYRNAAGYRRYLEAFIAGG